MDAGIRKILIDKSHLYHAALLIALDHLPSQSFVVAVTKNIIGGIHSTFRFNYFRKLI